MATLTAVQRRASIRNLVMDTVSPRVVALREETDDHWLAIVGEVASAKDVQTANRITVDLLKNRASVEVAFNLADAYLDTDWIDDKDLHLRLIRILTPECQATDPLGLTGCLGHGNMISDAMKAVWTKTSPGVKYKLKTPMKIISTSPPPRDIPGQCSLTDPAEYNDSELDIDIDMYVPSDCRTEREFRSRATKIGKDAASLYEQLQAATSNCRSVASLIKVVPSLEPYVEDPGEAETVKTMDVNRLLKRVAKG